MFNHETGEVSEGDIIEYDDIFGFFKSETDVLLNYIYDSEVY